MIFARLLLQDQSDPPVHDLLLQAYFTRRSTAGRQGVPSRDITDLIRRYGAELRPSYDANLARHHLVNQLPREPHLLLRHPVQFFMVTVFLVKHDDTVKAKRHSVRPTG